MKNKFMKMLALLLCAVLMASSLSACTDNDAEETNSYESYTDGAYEDETKSEGEPASEPGKPDFTRYTQNLPESIILMDEGKEATVTSSSTAREILAQLGAEPTEEDLSEEGTGFTRYQIGEHAAFYNITFHEWGTDPSKEKVFLGTVQIDYNPDRETSILGIKSGDTIEDVLNVLGAPTEYNQCSPKDNYTWENITIGNSTFGVFIEANEGTPLDSLMITFEVPQE